MLSKTLKHDMRSILPLWLFLSGIVLFVSVILGFSVRDLIVNAQRPDYVPILSMFGICISIFVMVGYSLATVIFIAVRFYQNFYTDEGYLTFTLPVPRRTLFFSKLLTGVIFVFATTVVFVTTVCIAFLIAPTSASDATPLLYSVANMLWDLFASMFSNFADASLLVAYLVVILAVGIVGAVYEILAMYLCITVGAVLAKKWKIAAAILCYYLTGVVINIFSSIGQVLSIFVTPSFTIVLMEMPDRLAGVCILLLLLAVFGFAVILTSAMYQFTRHMIEKKLNLP